MSLYWYKQITTGIRLRNTLVWRSCYATNCASNFN